MRSAPVDRQRSQAIVEFAIVAPVLVLLLFGVVDFGRLIYIYATLNQAVNEGTRAAIREIGYVNEDDVFHADKVFITNVITAQSSDIAQGVDARSAEGRAGFPSPFREVNLEKKRMAAKRRKKGLQMVA